MNSETEKIEATVSIEEGHLTVVRLMASCFNSEQLDTIDKALVGLPVDLSTAAFAAHIATAVPYGMACAKGLPTHLARAVRTAIVSTPECERIGQYKPHEVDQLTQSWRNFPWRVIHEAPLTAAESVALDEVLVERVAAVKSPPTLRFWGWTEPAVVIGRCQSVVNEVDLEAAAERGFRVVRRMSGGGAMFHEPHGAITYSMIVPEDALRSLTLRQSYEVCDAWAIRSLREMGIDVHHVPVNDMACAQGKIGGAAQCRRRGVVLHHATIAYELDEARMAAVLRIGRDRLSSKAVASAAKRVAPLCWQTQLSRENVLQRLSATFLEAYSGQVGSISPEENQESVRLATEKYGSCEWTHEFE